MVNFVSYQEFETIVVIVGRGGEHQVVEGTSYKYIIKVKLLDDNWPVKADYTRYYIVLTHERGIKH